MQSPSSSSSISSTNVQNYPLQKKEFSDNTPVKTLPQASPTEIITPVTLDLAGSYKSSQESHDYLESHFSDSKSLGNVSGSIDASNRRRECPDNNDGIIGNITDDEEDDESTFGGSSSLEINGNNIISQFFDIEENKLLENVEKGGSQTTRESQGSTDVEELLFGDIEL